MICCGISLQLNKMSQTKLSKGFPVIKSLHIGCLHPTINLFIKDCRWREIVMTSYNLYFTWTCNVFSRGSLVTGIVFL